MSKSLRVRFRAFSTHMAYIDTRGIEANAIALIRKHINKVVEDVRPYPARRKPRTDGLWYARTHGLEKGWRTRVYRETNTYIGSIFNVKQYATFVQGPFQTLMHESQGWKKLEDYLDRIGFHQAVRKFVDQMLKTKSR